MYLRKKHIYTYINVYVRILVAEVRKWIVRDTFSGEWTIFASYLTL